MDLKTVKKLIQADIERSNDKGLTRASYSAETKRAMLALYNEYSGSKTELLEKLGLGRNTIHQWKKAGYRPEGQVREKELQVTPEKPVTKPAETMQVEYNNVKIIGPVVDVMNLLGRLKR